MHDCITTPHAQQRSTYTLKCQSKTQFKDVSAVALVLSLELAKKLDNQQILNPYYAARNLKRRGISQNQIKRVQHTLTSMLIINNNKTVRKLIHQRFKKDSVTANIVYRHTRYRQINRLAPNKGKKAQKLIIVNLFYL